MPGLTGHLMLKLTESSLVMPGNEYIQIEIPDRVGDDAKSSDTIMPGCSKLVMPGLTGHLILQQDPELYLAKDLSTVD